MAASSRDPVTGRFVSTRNTPESGEGKFETYADDLPVEHAGGRPCGPRIRRRAPPRTRRGRPGPGRPVEPVAPAHGEADQRPLRRHDRDLHARPDRATLHADTMREAVGPDAGDLDPVHYLVGNITGIQE